MERVRAYAHGFVLNWGSIPIKSDHNWLSEWWRPSPNQMLASLVCYVEGLEYAVTLSLPRPRKDGTEGLRSAPSFRLVIIMNCNRWSTHTLRLKVCYPDES